MNQDIPKDFKEQWDTYLQSKTNVKEYIDSIKDDTLYVQIYVNMIISDDEVILNYMEEGKKRKSLLTQCLTLQPYLFHIVYRRLIEITGQRYMLDIALLDRPYIEDRQEFIMDLLCKGLYPFGIETVGDVIENNVRESCREHFGESIINAEFERTDKISRGFFKLMIRFEIYPESIIEKIKSMNSSILLNIVSPFAKEALVFFAKIGMYDIVILIAGELACKWGKKTVPIEVERRFGY